MREHETTQDATCKLELMIMGDPGLHRLAAGDGRSVPGRHLSLLRSCTEWEG